MGKIEKLAKLGRDMDILLRRLEAAEDGPEILSIGQDIADKRKEISDVENSRD